MMKTINFELNKKLLFWCGVLHLFIALYYFFGLAPGQDLLFWRLFALMLSLLGIGLIFSSSEPETHWPIIAVGLLEKAGEIALFAALYMNDSLSRGPFVTVLLRSLVFGFFFLRLLLDAFRSNTHEESVPKQFSDLLKIIKTSDGESLLEKSEKENILLIFVRHFGCTFCRETVSEISQLEEKLKGKNLTPVYVHMSDPSFGEQFFSRYYDHKVAHVSDPQRFLYKSLGLKRGSLGQIFGLPVFLRLFWSGLFKGHGAGPVEGDFLQLGGFFILKKGQVVFEHKTRRASDIFKLDFLPQI